MNSLHPFLWLLSLSKNKDTGWAEFKTFRARFESGKVAEVSVK